jgi:hypothetical protein
MSWRPWTPSRTNISMSDEENPLSPFAGKGEL